MFEVICYRAKFEEFRKFGSGWVGALPADHNEDFALICAIDEKGALGFDSSPSMRALIKKIILECYCVDISGVLMAPGGVKGKYMPMIFFKDRCGEFNSMVVEHERYLLALKKHSILSRYKPVELPASNPLSDFLMGEKRTISKSLYESLKKTCEFFCVAKLSGEYGWGAFDVTSRDLDGFLTKLKDYMPSEGRVTFRSSIKEVPCW